MKKTNNKGFSLVELIIVIAIMAILAGAIAPALIRYIDKSRKSNDVTAAKTIKTAVETALGNEDIYAYLTNVSKKGGFTTITINPGFATEENAPTSKAIDITGCDKPATGLSVKDVVEFAKAEIGTNIGEKTPKLKYTKANSDTKSCGCTVKPEKFYALISEKGTVYVVIGGDTPPANLPTDLANYSDAYAICPEVCAAYQ